VDIAASRVCYEKLGLYLLDGDKAKSWLPCYGRPGFAVIDPRGQAIVVNQHV
jgi:hypothetical protein